MESPPTIINQIKIFARISPESKALIIKSIKKGFNEEFSNRSRILKIFGPSKSRVGMTGDGANDLIAIHDADVGIGMSKCDASYAATFTIRNISDVNRIIR